MKRFGTAFLIILMALCLVLSGCETRSGNSPSSASEPEVETPSSSAPESPSSAPESEEESSEEESSEEESLPDIELTFEDRVILNYGGSLESTTPGARIMRTDVVSFFYIDDWTNAMDIEAGAFYSWYLSYMLKEDITPEERAAKYKSPRPEDEGWFFPQDIYESTIMRYFDVTVEHLRSERLIYDPELEGYYLGGGGGIGDRPILSADSVTEDGDLRTIRVRMQPQSPPDASPEYKLLTVRMEDGGGYKFVSYVTE